MNTPLEDQVHDALARRVEPLHHAPLALDGVRRRARRIQRRRRAVAGAAVAAVLAIAIPVGLTLDGPARRSEQPPVDRTPGVVGTVRIDPRSASQGAGPAIPLADSSARTITVGDDVVQLPSDYYQVTQYGDGWLGARRQDDGLRRIDILKPDLSVEDGADDTTGFTVSPDGTQVAWAMQTRTDQWSVAVNDTAREEPERPWATVPVGPEGGLVQVVGFLSDHEVVLSRIRNAGSPLVSYFVADGADVRPLRGLRPGTASPVTHLLAGGVDGPGGSSCGAMWSGEDLGAGPLWTDCEHAPLQLSPGGVTLAAYPAPVESIAGGDPTSLSLLDAATGRVLVDFEVTPVRDRVVGIATQVAWEDDEHLLATYTDGDQQWVVRLGTDGSVERVAGPVTVDSGTVVLQVSPGRS